MPFASFRYVFLFLPFASAVYYFSAKYLSNRVAKTVLIVASLIFYGSGGLINLPILIASIFFNYRIAKSIVSSADGRRRSLLVIGILVNVALLATFKYTIFLLGFIAPFGKGMPTLPGWADWGLPLGISFFTIQQVMYLVDCYEGLIGASNLWTHTAFVSCFAYVVSGPLTRARQLVPQIESAVPTDSSRVSQAIFLFGLGLCKKVAIADSFGRIADAGYAQPGALSAVEAWASSLSYTFQIYFDFSGYTDMAIATGLLFGFTLPINFNSPYRSLSIIEFWQRWHITLSQFITTYLYTPIVRSFRRVTLVKASFATLLAMTIAGLWHGPSWTFVAFGSLHGVALVINQVWRKKIKKHVPRFVSWLITFLFVNLAFVFFRSPSISVALEMIRAQLPFHDLRSLAVFRQSVRLDELVVIGLPALLGLVVAMFGDTAKALSESFRPRFATACAAAGLILIAVIYMNSTFTKEFIYFGF